MLALGLAGAVLILVGCSAEDYAREEALPLPRSAEEVRAERLLNEFSANLDGGDFAAACQQMTRVLQLRYAIQSGRRNGGCESAMGTIADAGGLGRIEVQGTDQTKRGIWADAGKAEFLIRYDRIADIRQR
ncbi:MAG TPA: hypothetical protein VK480_00425 [Solirubrobacterales bacterium]|nr:hypothetical protein [Solirubrobacterales bacterium]